MDTARLKDGTTHPQIKFSHLSAMLTLQSPEDDRSPGFPKQHSRRRLQAVVRPASIWCTSGVLWHDSFGCCRYLCTERLGRTSGTSTFWTTTSAISSGVGAFPI